MISRAVLLLAGLAAAQVSAQPAVQGTASGYHGEMMSSYSPTVNIDSGATFAMTCGELFNGTGDTVSATLGGQSPTISDQGQFAEGERWYCFGWADPPTGNQTLALSGGDAEDEWFGIVSEWTGVDPVTPWSNMAATQTASATVATTADGMAVGFASYNNNPTPGQTQILEYVNSFENWYANLQRADGTGGNVTLSWTGTGLYWAVRMNLNAEAPEPDPPEITSITPEEFEDEDTGIVIAGSDFGETEGDVLICPTDDSGDMDCEVQTVTAWADDEITFTAVQGGLSGGLNYTFVITDDALVNADGFEVTFTEPIVATKLIFGSQPGNVVVGQVFGAFTVRAVDDDDALDESYTDEVTLSLCTGDGTLGGTTAKNAAAGIATFDDIFLNTLNTDATICANDGALTEGESDPFDVTAGGEGGTTGMPATSTLGGALQR